VASCDRGDKVACATLASRCAIGRKGDVPWESAACAERERKACYAGDAFFGRKLSDRYTSVTDDVGVPKDEAMAAKLVERACEGGDGMDSCMNIAARYETGDGVAKDVARAVAFWERV
jgi:TPR repeat protein